MMKRTAKWLKRGFITILVLMISVFLLLAGTLFTNPGLKLVLWGAQKAVPALSVNVDKTEGALLPHFTLHNVGYTDQQLTVDLKLSSLSLGINPHCFLTPSVCVDEFKLDGLNFSLAELPTSEEEVSGDTQESPAEINLPIGIDLNNVEFSNINLDILGNKVDWKRFSTQIGMSGSTLTIYPTQFYDINLELGEPESSEPAPKADKEPEISKDNQVAKPIVLPEVDIPLEIDLQELDLRRFNLKGDTPFTVNSLLLKAHAENNDIEIKQLELDVPQADLSLNTKVTLKGGYPLELNAQADVKQTDLRGQKLKLSADGSVEQLNLHASLSELVKASLEGKVSPLDPKLPFELSLQKGHVSWPFTGKTEYVVDVHSLQTSGSLDGYQLKLDTNVKGNAIPELDLTVSGKGDLNQIELETITLNTLGGEVSGQVMANWQEPVNWKAALSLSDIQPGLQWEDAEGNISGSLTTSGELTAAGGWRVVVPELDIDGIIRGYPLDLAGSFEASDLEGKGDFQLNTTGLNLKHGVNGIYVEGSVDKTLHLDTRINFPDIAKSVPDAKGRLSGKLNLRGDLKKPRLETQLTARNLSYQDAASVSSISLRGGISPLPVPEGQINLLVKGIEAQGNKFDSLDVSFSGSQQKHGLTISMLSELLNFNLHVSGGLEEKPELKWVGVLNGANFETEQGPWSLNHPVNMSFLLNEQLAKVQAHCWSQANSSVCLTKDITAGKSGDAEIAIKNFDFEQVKMFMPEDIQVHGAVDVVSRASWAPDVSPQAETHVNLSSGKVIQTGETTVELGWDSITANAVLKKDKLSLDWDLNLTDNGTVEGNATIPNVRAKEQSIDANLAIKQITMDMLKPLLGEYSKLEAQLDSELHVSGPVMQPAVKGSLSLHDLVVAGEIAPIEVKKGRVNVAFNGYNAVLDADIESADGLLTVDGDAVWKDMSAWYTRIKVHSDELNVNLPPMVRVKVKPDMAITLTPELAKIDGDIYLPWGRITIEELPPSAVSVSSDQVILDENLKPLETKSAIPMVLETNVNIHIGDDFDLSAFGLKGG
ncbi:translocation/assembly module TamB domain-containing protein [Vibrio hannami]